MSRQDPGAATGQAYTERTPKRCRCGHNDSFHVAVTPLRRGVCSAWNCDCQKYWEEARDG